MKDRPSPTLIHQKVTFRCHCGKEELVERPGGMPGVPAMAVGPALPPAGWETFSFWAQSRRSGVVRMVQLSTCSHACSHRLMASDEIRAELARLEWGKDP